MTYRLPEEIKTIARSMITASHANNLNDKQFEEYLEELLDVAKPLIEADLLAKVPTPEKLKEEMIIAFDLARQEGMLHSKDGKHSQSSESDAEDLMGSIRLSTLHLLEQVRKEEWDKTVSKFNIFLHDKFHKVTTSKEYEDFWGVLQKEG